MTPAALVSKGQERLQEVASGGEQPRPAEADAWVNVGASRWLPFST
jgi:hypothetical protein